MITEVDRVRGTIVQHELSDGSYVMEFLPVPNGSVKIIRRRYLLPDN